MDDFKKALKTVTLSRHSDDGKETLGELTAGGFKCYALERPWLNNNRMVSCVPKGTYTCKWAYMGNMKVYHYLLQNVKDRSGCFIHPGNFYFDTEGCILLGDSFGDRNKDGITDVLNSRATIARFEKLMNKEDFKLIIQ